jgi:hypothetical protein
VKVYQLTQIRNSSSQEVEILSSHRPARFEMLKRYYLKKEDAEQMKLVLESARNKLNLFDVYFNIDELDVIEELNKETT